MPAVSGKMPALPGLIVQNDSSPSIRSVIPTTRTFPERSLTGSTRPTCGLCQSGMVLAILLGARDFCARIPPSLEPIQSCDLGDSN